MRFKRFFITTIFITFFSCTHSDKQPCDNNYIKGINSLLSFQLDSSKNQFQASIRENPHNAFAYYGKAEVLFLDGDENAATDYYDTAINLDPSFVFAYYKRASLFAPLGQHSKAVADMNKVIELKPDFSFGYYTRATYKYAL